VSNPPDYGISPATAGNGLAMVIWPTRWTARIDWFIDYLKEEKRLHIDIACRF
jgi:hypothetical protein